jgi:hypothetical protein
VRPGQPPGIDKLIAGHYPLQQLLAAHGGRAMVRFSVDPQGHVRVLATLAESEASFGDACSRALSGTVWKPGRDDGGEPQSSTATFLCEFEAKNNIAPVLPDGERSTSEPTTLVIALNYVAGQLTKLELSQVLGSLDLHWLGCVAAAPPKRVALHRLVLRANREGRIVEQRWARPPPPALATCTEDYVQRLQLPIKPGPSVFELDFAFVVRADTEQRSAPPSITITLAD